MKNIFSTFLLCTSLLSYAQTEYNGSEIGVELHGGASNLGGTFSLGLKYAAIFNENFAAGPSLRLNRIWNNTVYPA